MPELLQRLARWRRSKDPVTETATIEAIAIEPRGWTSIHGSAAEPQTAPGRPVRCWAEHRHGEALLVTCGVVEKAGRLELAHQLQAFAGYRAPDGRFYSDGPCLPHRSLAELLGEIRQVIDPDLRQVLLERALTAASECEWATSALAEFRVDPERWFELHRLGELERTETILANRLRELSELNSHAPIPQTLRTLADDLEGNQ